MAIVSKAVFEKAAGKSPAVGARLEMDRYVSANKNLEPLADRGRLFLVTVRPPNEALWLVAVLEAPKFDGAQWTSKPATTPITDISSLRKKLKFESGTGITAAAGALGMSLQTPRKLTHDDVALLDAAVAAASGGGKAKAGGVAAAEDDEDDDGGDDDAGGGHADEIVQSSGGRSDALLAAILADPDDNAARQVYADALAQRNDPRGELIHVELACAGPLSIRKREGLSNRKAELLAANAATWFPYKLTYRTHRGFIASVEGSLQQLHTAREVFDREPVTEVLVRDVDAGKLAKAAWLPRVRRLIVRGELGDEGFEQLVASKGLGKLRELNVTATELTGEALAALGDHLPQCISLVLTGNALGDVGGLAAWTHVGNVEKLYLANCELDDLGPLLARPLPSLAKLCLNGNGLGAGVATAIAKAAARLPALRRLELAGSRVDNAGAKLLLGKLHHDLRLDVRNTGVTAEGLGEHRGRASVGGTGRGGGGGGDDDDDE
jgi:uncharacterized protein (TIGR02996 family)